MNPLNTHSVYSYKLKAWVLFVMLGMTVFAAILASTSGISHTTKSGQPVHPVVWFLLGAGLVGWVLHCSMLVYDQFTGGKQVVLGQSGIEIPRYFGKRRTSVAYGTISKLAFGHKGILWIFTPGKRYGVHRSLFETPVKFEEFFSKLSQACSGVEGAPPR